MSTSACTSTVTSAQVLTWLRSHLNESAHLASDSRQLRIGDGFFAYAVGREPSLSDGRLHIADAQTAGAGAVLYEAGAHEIEAQINTVPCLEVPQLSWLAGEIASAWYHHPSQALSVIGITGTNGKTSCALWIAQALDQLGMRCGVIGTLGAGLPQSLKTTGFTTPDAVQLQRICHQLLTQGSKAIALEVSSHGLEQGRVNGMSFTTAVFTNLSRDHLDYHGDMDAYCAAKQRLFSWPHLRHAVINIDDPVGQAFLQTLRSDIHGVAYGQTQAMLLDHDGIYASDVIATTHGTKFVLTARIGGITRTATIQSLVLGKFNVSNLLAVMAVLLTQGVVWEKAIKVLAALSPVVGRMQQFGGQRAPLVVVDYAHTPDALAQALATLRDASLARNGRLWCVFGCGGNRDPGKRSQMGAVAQQADYVVLTSDNPRNEDPHAIIEMIKAGLAHPDQALQYEDRGNAILYAIRHASVNDVVLIAGKGHETWQEISGKKLPFNDAEHVCLALASIGANVGVRL